MSRARRSRMSTSSKRAVVSILTKMADATTIEVGMIGIEGAVGTATLLGGETSSQQALVQVSGSALRMSAAECKAAFDQSPAVRAVMMRFIEGCGISAHKPPRATGSTRSSRDAPVGC